jgi:TonB family protein
MKYPDEARKKMIQGKVIATFDILESGDITNIKIIESAHPLLDAELVRVLEMSPKWNAAMKNGLPVRTTYTFPFLFLLR